MPRLIEEHRDIFGLDGFSGKVSFEVVYCQAEIATIKRIEVTVVVEKLDEVLFQPGIISVNNR